MTVIIFILPLILSHNILLNKLQSQSDARIVIPKIVFNISKEHPINGIGYGQFVTKFNQYVDYQIYDNAPSEILDLLANYYYQFGYSPSVGFNKFKIVDKYKDGNGANSEMANPYSSTQVSERMTHNDLLTIISELGLIGLMCVFFIFYKIYAQMRKILFFNREYYFVSISMIGSSLIFSFFHHNLSSFMFWFIIYIPFIITRNYKKI